MVQKNGQDVLNPKIKLQTRRYKTEKNISFDNSNQDIQNKEVANLRKKLKKERSIKRISELENLEAHVVQKVLYHDKAGMQKKTRAPVSKPPNYMKPTTSSDARNERPKVSVQIPINRENPISSNNLGSSCKSKPAKVLTKVLTWKSSLRISSNTSKKCSGLHIHPKINASKATCSSTLKKSIFPEELELSPGATKAEGTSTVKVCPYTYCSLNGHKHRALPSIKSFKAARRRSLKIRKSLKLRGIPSLRKRGSWKSKSQNMDGDFFANTHTGTCIELEKLFFFKSKSLAVDDDSNDSSFSEISSFRESKRESGTRILNCLADGSSSEASIEGNLAHGGDTSVSEKESSTAKYNVHHDERESELQVHGSRYSEKNNLLHHYSDNEKLCKSEAQEIFPETTYIEIAKEISVCNDIWLDVSNKTVLEKRELEATTETAKQMSVYNSISLVDDGTTDATMSGEREHEIFSEDNHKDLSGDTCESKHAQMDETQKCEPEREANKDYIDGDEHFGMDETQKRKQEREINKEYIDEDEHLSINISTDENTQTDVSCDDGTKDFANTLSTEACDDVPEKILESPQRAQPNNVNFLGFTFLDRQKDMLDEGEYGTNVGSAQEQKVVHTNILYSDYDDFQRKRENNEVTETKNVIEIHVLDATFVDHYQHNTDDDVENLKPDSDVTQSDIGSFKGIMEKTENVKLHDCRTERVVTSTFNVWDNSTNHETRIKDYQEPHGNREKLLITTHDKFLSETDEEMKARFRVTRTRIIEEQEKLKVFNPQEPNFLPVEPDPGSEIIDLRHFMMDDNKNAEEWMVDYRLQRVVSSLRPACKRKVELLVEAFEAVKPLPLYEVSPSPSNGSPFDQAQVTQSCSQYL